jgi:hypothetical protein
METFVDTDSRWMTRPSWSCVTPMIMGIAPFQNGFSRHTALARQSRLRGHAGLMYFH